ncbi:MAG: ABC transporter ATP-binding protein [Candidatus Methanomethylophilaceae archaeon]|nr:ABC transporter ATP-binding protein [Candidatus Methanomethylophilaceae archaeon]
MSRSTGRTLGFYLRPYSWEILVIVTFQAIGVVMQVLAIGMLRPILDSSVEGYGVEYILDEGVILLGMTIAFAVFVSLASRMSSQLSLSVSSDMRRDVLASSLKVQRLDSVGDMGSFSMTCLTSDVQEVQEHVFKSFSTYLALPFLATAMVACTYMINATVGVMVIMAMISVILITYLLSRRTYEAYAEKIVSLDNLNTMFKEEVKGARMIRAFGGKDHEMEKYLRASNTYGSCTKRIALNSYYLPSFSMAFVWIFVVMVYMIAALGLSSHVIRPTHLVLFMQFTTCIISSLALVPYICLSIPRARVSMRRIGGVSGLHESPVPNTERAEDPCDLRASGTRFEDGFGRVMLDGLDLEIPRGTVATVTGANGCGLTELVDIVTAFSLPTSGSVSVCGMDVGSSDPRDIRRAVSYAGRQSGVFSGTIRFNLDPAGACDDDSILEMCRRTGFIDYVELSEGGLDAKVYSAMMSGGQVQLMALTRCLLRDAEMYVLDDCLFSMDEATRRKAVRAVLDVRRGRTVFFASHEMDTVEVSDVVFLMKDGRIVDSGTHERLMSCSGAYYEMYSRSSGGIVC